MGRFVKGDVVVVPFPFSDLSLSKKRPAFVLADLKGDDYILCQITSKHKSDQYSVTLEKSDFKTGQLNITSNIRVNRIFTADEKIIEYKIGSVCNKKNLAVKKKLFHLFN